MARERCDSTNVLGSRHGDSSSQHENPFWSDPETATNKVPMLEHDIDTSRSASPPITPGSQPVKRKRAPVPNPNAETESAPAARATKRKKVKEGKAEDDREIDLEAGVNLAIGKMDAPLLADYVAQRTKRFGGDLSVVELGDKHIPGMNCPRYIYHSTHTDPAMHRESIPGYDRLAKDEGPRQPPRLPRALLHADGTVAFAGVGAEEQRKPPYDRHHWSRATGCKYHEVSH